MEKQQYATLGTLSLDMEVWLHHESPQRAVVLVQTYHVIKTEVKSEVTLSEEQSIYAVSCFIKPNWSLGIFWACLDQ
jgi:hypothetical protein